MRAAMAAAPVGDDVFGDDPTVTALQANVAELLGKEAGLFVTSGTQSNLCALLAHCGRGDEYIAGENAHSFKYEAGGAAVLGSAMALAESMQADLRTSPIEVQVINPGFIKLVLKILIL